MRFNVFISESVTCFFFFANEKPKDCPTIWFVPNIGDCIAIALNRSTADTRKVYVFILAKFVTDLAKERNKQLGADITIQNTTL